MVEIPELTGSTADCFAENMGEMGRGDEAYGLADLRDGEIGVRQQVLCFFAAEMMMTGQGRHACISFECAGQIAAVDKERVCHFLQRKFLGAVGFHIGPGRFREGSAAGFLIVQDKSPSRFIHV